MQKSWVRSLGQEEPLEKEMATCSSILVWEIPWTEYTQYFVITYKGKESEKEHVCVCVCMCVCV